MLTDHQTNLVGVILISAFAGFAIGMGLGSMWADRRNKKRYAQFTAELARATIAKDTPPNSGMEKSSGVVAQAIPRERCEVCKHGRDTAIFAGSPVICTIDCKQHAATYCCAQFERMTMEDAKNLRGHLIVPSNPWSRGPETTEEALARYEREHGHPPGGLKVHHPSPPATKSNPLGLNWQEGNSERLGP